MSTTDTADPRSEWAYCPQPVHNLPDDPTLDEVRAYLAEGIASEAVFDGWDDMAVVNAAEAAGVDPDIAKLAFPGGAMDMIDAWITSVDARLIEEQTPEALAEMKIRDRITTLVRTRIEYAIPYKEALRRSLAIMGNPLNASRAARISWRTSDLMWRMAGDTATDYNHYTKRMILTAVYGSTLLAFIDDDGEDHEETWAFLDRRIGNVMQFEKVKAKVLNRDVDRPSLMRFLGRMRYPSR